MSRKTRKLMWSAPLVAVLAVAGALAIFAAQGPGAALAHDPPGVVMNLTGEADGQNEIDLSWDAPANGGAPDHYRIDRSEDGNTWLSHKMEHTMRTYSDTGLKPASTYYYRIFAVNSAGTGPVSRDFLVQTDTGMAPSAVIQVRAAAMGQNQVNVTWKAPAKLNGSPVTKYWVHGAPAGTDLPASSIAPDAVASPAVVVEVNAADGMSYSHKKLTANTRYSYRVYAENAHGKSDAPSNTAGATTAALVKPGAPSGLVASQATGRAYNLYWHAPTSNGGTPPIKYTVQVSYNGQAFKDAGDALTTKWDSEAATGGAAATATVDAVVTVPADLGDDASTAITTVAFRVYTVTREDDGDTPGIDEELKSDRYAPSERYTLLADAGIPSRIPAAPGFAAANAVRNSKGNVVLTWTAPAIDSDDTAADNAPDSIGGYRIDVSDDGVNWSGLVHHSRKTDTKYEYNDPEKKDRSYRIFAWHAQWLGPAQTTVVESSLLTATHGDPGHVSGFTAAAAGPSQIDLTWTAPANDGNAEIVLYRIDGARRMADGAFADFPTVTSPAGSLPTVDSDTSDGVVTATSKTTSYSHKELKAGETWQYRVLAVNDNEAASENIRTAPPGSAETRTATTSQAALPVAPEGLTAEDAKDSSLQGALARGVLLLWNAPNPPDGANIDGYRVQRKKDDAAWETIAMDTNSVYTNYTDSSEPAEGETRMYRVAALNGTKVGAHSAPVYYPYSAERHTHVMASGTIPAQTVRAGMSTDAMDVSGYFDADPGDTLTYTAESDMKMYATANIPAGTSMLTITGVAEGEARITVTAAGGKGGTATQSFMVTVLPANAAPRLPDDQDPGTPMLPTTVSLAVGKSEVIDLTGSFVDPDGDTLTYTATSSMEKYATAKVGEDDMLTIKGVAAGEATVTVTADDGKGGTATHDIAVTVTMGVPGMPMNVMATADSHTRITVSWDAPASDGGSAITGYIIERRYTGDMMGNIPHDGYNDAAGGRSFAFTNHMNWWETLNCKGMLRVAGSVADPELDSDDKAMYCQHYDMTAPSNTAGTIMTDGELDMKIKALFDKRYEILTGTDTSHTDMDLMAETEYTYRVSAVNAKGRSPWSAPPVMATTQATPMVTLPTNIVVNHRGVTVTVTWDGGENADTFAVALIRRDADGNWDIPNAVYDTGVPRSPHEVNMATRPAGTYHVFVIAGSAARGWTSWVSGSLEYMP